MAFTENINQLQKDSFADVGSTPARRVTLVETISIPVTSTPSGNEYRIGGMIGGSLCDYVSASYPTSTTVVTVYKTGGSGGSLLKTVTDTYDSSGNFLTSEAT